MLRLGAWGRPNDINEGCNILIIYHITTILYLTPSFCISLSPSLPFPSLPFHSVAVILAIKSTGLSEFSTANTKQLTNNDNDDNNNDDDKAGFIERYTVARQLGLKRSNAEYSPTGYVLALNTLQRRMEDRLRLVEYLNNHPEVSSIEMKPPVFAVGFPRTGTTFLHELLGLHPNVRMHYTWEQMSPVPLSNDTSIEALGKDRKTRYIKNKSRMQWFLTLAGDAIQNIHRVGYDEPEECTTPLASDVPWSIPEIGFITYAAEEVNKIGAGHAFEHYYEYLQLLTFQAKERRNVDFTWMLKCPFHLPYLSELYKAFPGSTVVWTHRDPCECIASACSLYETIMAFTLEPNSIDRAALGRAVLNYTKQALLRAFKTLESEKVNIIHVKYKDTIKSPKLVTEKIYKQTGIDYTKEYNDKLDEYLKENEAKRAAAKSKNERKEMHTYNLLDYGLTKAWVQKEFQDYINDYCN